MKRFISLCFISALAILAGCTGYPNFTHGPTGVSASAGDAQVSLTWTSVAGATSYDVYYATVSGQSVTSYGDSLNVTGTSFTKTGLKNGTPYYFVVTAQSISGESEPSAAVSATPGAPTKGQAPAAPTGLQSTAGNAQVSLTWTKSTGAASYNIYYGVTPAEASKSGNKVSGISGTTAVVPQLNNDVVYYFAVTAVGAGGESGLSNVTSATPTTGTTVSLTPGTPGTATLQANSSTSLIYSFPADAVGVPVIITIAGIAQTGLPAPLPQAKDTFVASFLIANNPVSITAYQAAVGVSGSVATSFTAGTTLNLALLKGKAWSDVATFVVGANGAITENIASLTLPGLLAPGTYLLYQPVSGSTTSVSNLGVVLLADDGSGMADGHNGIQVIQIYDKLGNLLPTPTVTYLDYSTAYDLDGLALTPDGSQGIMVDGGNTVRFFSGTQTGTTKASTTTVNISAYGGDGDSVAILPNGDEAVVSGDGATANLLISGIVSGKPVAAETIAIPSNRDGLVISNDGKVLLARGGSGLTVYSIASISPKAGSIGGTVSHSFTQTADLPALGTYYTEDGRDGMSLSPVDSSRALIVNPANSSLQLVTGLPGAPAAGTALVLPAEPVCATITPDGKMAIVGTSGGLVLISGVDTGKLAIVGGLYAPTYSAGTSNYTLGYVTTLSVTLDNKYVVAGDVYHRAIVVVPFTAAGFAAAPAAAASNLAIPNNDQLSIH